MDDSAQQRVQHRLALRDRWESASTIPLIIVSGLFIVSYSAYVIFVEFPPEVRAGIFVVLVLIWILFFIDYVARLIITPSGFRWAFVRKNVIDLLSVLFPLFRTFRLVSLLGRIPYFQGRSGTAVRSRVVIYAAGYAILFVYFIALATLQAERYAPGATITSFGNAVWWACVTLFTVGYGDTYPVTVLGRFWAVVLMAGGIVIIGTTSAIVVSYLSERVRRKD